MKIVCDACQAKYSISDDKVQGKVFKIRCKKCSNIIVVRGGANAAEAAPPPEQNKETHVYDYGYDGGGQPAGDEAVWHVVINQDQVGPMTAAEVQQRFGAGEIDADTYIWREGFSDWLPIAQVDTFAAFAAGQAHAHAPVHGGGGGADAVAAMFGGGSGSEDAGTMRSDPGDLFAAASASTPPQDDDGGDLFGSRPAGGGGVSSNAQAQAAGSKMRGERNENSVLFSLNNLAQLASDKPQPMTSAPSGHATGQAGGEGSGLIDIRSMASAYLGGGGAGAKATTSSIGTIDDLPVFGGSGFSEPAVIVPTSRPAANNKILYAMIGAVGLLAVVAVIMVVVLLGNKGGGDKVASNDKAGGATDKIDKDKPEKDDKTGATTPPPSTDSGSAKVADTGSAAKVADTGSAATPPPATGSDTGSAATNPADNGSAATQVAIKDPVKKDPPKHDPPKADPPKHDPPKTTPEVKKDPTPKPPDPKKDDPKKTPTAGGDCDEVSCVLNNNAGTCCAKFKKGGSTSPTATTAKPAGDLPESLDRDMINNGVGTASGAAKACGNKSSAKGKVKVHVKVGPAGNVVDVSVSETPDAALGNCVAAAMQRAHFGKTQKGGSFAYPFVF